MHCCFDCKTIATRSFALAHICSIDDGPLMQMRRAAPIVRFAMDMSAVDDNLQESWEALRSVTFAVQARPVSFIPDGIEEDYHLGYNAKKMVLGLCQRQVQSVQQPMKVTVTAPQQVLP